MKTTHHSILSTPAIRSGDQTQNNSIRRKWFALALGGFLFTSIFALSAPPVEAGCQQWDVSGDWNITQGSYFITVALSQSGKTINGTAQQNWVSDHQVRVLNGQVTGTIAGAMFYVQILWSGGGVGVYSGEIIKGGGGLMGTTYDKSNLQSTARWSSDHHFNCADAAPAPAAPVIPKPDATKSTSAAADDWINQELRKRKTAKPAATPVSGSGTAGGFIQMHTPAPTSSAEADESSSNQHKKNKNKKKHHHDDDDQDQGND